MDKEEIIATEVKKKAEKLSYKDSWDDIQEVMKSDLDYIRPPGKAAFEMKVALTSIEQQKENAKLQDRLLTQSRVLSGSTILLAIFTAILCVVTFLNYTGSKNQLTALKHQSDSIIKLEKSIKSIEKVVSKNLIKSLHEVAGAAAKAGKPNPNSSMEQNKRIRR